MTINEFDQSIKTLIAAAHAAGEEAAAKCVPTPMIVGTPKTFLGSGIDYSKPVEYVAGGVCGFAYIQFSKKQRKLFNSFKRLNVGTRDEYGHADSYLGGWYMTPNGAAQSTQSMAIKEDYCRAFAQVIRDAGYSAHMRSRID